MPRLPDPGDLEALKAFDTPTICNALELVVPARRAIGFTRRPLFAAFPRLKPVVAFARTAIIRSREPHPRSREDAKEVRLGYYAHIAAEPLPSIAIIQDIDAPDIGFGAFWGEVQSHIHKGLGCAGVITDGSVRDLDAMAPDFLVLAGSVMPSHAHVHLVDYAGTVSVAGMVVSPNDIILDDGDARQRLGGDMRVIAEPHLFGVFTAARMRFPGADDRGAGKGDDRLEPRESSEQRLRV